MTAYLAKLQTQLPFLYKVTSVFFQIQFKFVANFDLSFIKNNKKKKTPLAPSHEPFLLSLKNPSFFGCSFGG
jgi:hypothetical protein